MQAALQERDRELADTKRVLAELKDYAEQLQNRVVELIAGGRTDGEGAAYRPGVKTYLLQRFHPDKYPDPVDRQRELFTEAFKTITAAYVVASTLQPQSSE